MPELAVHQFLSYHGLTMPEPIDSSLARRVLQLLESMHGAGIEQLPKVSAARPGPTHAVTATAPGPTVDAEDQVLAAQVTEPPTGEVPLVTEAPAETNLTPASTLEILRDEVAGCIRCHELATTRTQTVFGVGNPAARLCFLGEAPGADEDRLGEPFVGRAGQLLNKILEACRLKRDDVYILNVIKCRPPGNRNPLPEEAANCRSYLNRQLGLIRPEFICCLGAVATQSLLGTNAPMSSMRGRVHDYQGVKVLCTYHPAYLLRNPAAKKDTWEDMKLLMREMGAPVD